MASTKNSYVSNIEDGRRAAVSRFLKEYNMSLEEFMAKTWNEWQSVPVFEAMLFVCLLL